MRPAQPVNVFRRAGRISRPSFPRSGNRLPAGPSSAGPLGRRSTSEGTRRRSGPEAQPGQIASSMNGTSGCRGSRRSRRRSVLRCRRPTRALAQPGAKRRMRQVGGGFGKRRHGKRLRGRAMAQPRNLRKDEPHPMTALAAGAELIQYGLVHRLLRINKPLQLKAIVHSPRRTYRSASRHRRQDLHDLRRGQIGVLF